MTLFCNTQRKCILCDHPYNYKRMISACILCIDLDTRMAILGGDSEMEACPSCNYCSPDISRLFCVTENCDKTAEEIRKIIESDIYKEQFNNGNYSKFVNACLCYSIISERLNQYSDAVRAYIYAAWRCDDEKNNILAVKFRKKALTFIQEAKKRGQSFASSEIDEYLINVDFLRRAEEFEKAFNLCNEGIEKFSKIEDRENKLNLEILNFQKKTYKRKKHRPLYNRPYRKRD